MAKPSPHLLEPDRYPFRTELDVRFSDLDFNRHTNNVSIVGFIEEGRVRFHKQSGFHAAIAEFEGMGGMVASMTVEFIGEGQYPGSVTIHGGAARIGTSSYELELLLRQDGRGIAFARTTLVCTRNRRPHPLPDNFRESVAAWMVRA